MMPPRLRCPLPFLLLSIVLAFAAAAGEPASQQDPVLVEIGDEKIRQEELVLYLRQAKPGLAFDRLPAAEKERLVEEFVARKLLALRAREEGLADDPQVRVRIAFFTDSVLGQALREKLREGIGVSEAEARAYYEAHREEFRLPPRYLLTHLLYVRPQGAREAKARLETGAPFEQFAAERGKNPDLRLAEQRWFTPDLLLPELVEVAAGLAVGEVSEVFETDHGHHVLRLERKDLARYLEFPEARAKAEEKVRQAKASQIYRQILEEAKQRHPVRTP